MRFVTDSMDISVPVPTLLDRSEWPAIRVRIGITTDVRHRDIPSMGANGICGSDTEVAYGRQG